MTILLALSPAFALDCTGRHAQTCAAVNDLAARVNAEAGGQVVHDGAPTRLKPATIYTQLNQLRQAANSSGCRAGLGFDGWDGGIYDSAAGPWSGSWRETGGTSGDASGVVNYGGRAFDGDFDGDETGLVGDRFGLFHPGGQFASNRDTDFLMGRWIRTVGRQGVYVGLHGACDPGQDIASDFDPWYAGDLSPYTADPLNTAWRTDPVYGGWVLLQTSGHFSLTDCNDNFMGVPTWDVNGHSFDIAATGGEIHGIPHNGHTFPAPIDGGLLSSVHLVHPGGRCSAQSLSMSFTFDDTTSESANALVIPHDCSNFGDITNGPGSVATRMGNYGGPCCDNWYQTTFDNPQPAKGVVSMTVTYSDGCGGGYPGQIWGVSAD